jgi:Flp pilus assembly protein TadD
VSRSRIAVVAMLTALLGGCGGSTGSTSASTCLEKAGATVKETKVTPTFQSTGVEHALVVTLHPGDRQALLLFAKNGILADQAEQQLSALVEQLAGQSNGELPVRRKGNVLVSWLTASTAADDELIDKCL